MNAAVEALRRMQGLDDRIRALGEERTEVASRCAGIEDEIRRAEENLEKLRAELLELQKREKSRELDLGCLEDRRAKLQAQLLAVKTNKEYAGLQDEIRNVSADIGQVEEAGLGDLAAIDESKERVSRAEEGILKLRAELESARALERSLSERIGGEVKVLRSSWEEHASGADPEALALYRRIAAARDGQAVASAEGGVCRGCFMNLTPQTVNLLMGGQELVQCRSCQRILFLPEKATDQA